MPSFRGPWRFPWSRLGAGVPAPPQPTTSLRGPWRWVLGRLGVGAGTPTAAVGSFTLTLTPAASFTLTLAPAASFTLTLED